MLDVVVAPARPLEPGTDVPGRVALVQGGSAANTARWLGRLGRADEPHRCGRARCRGPGAGRRDPDRRRDARVVARGRCPDRAGSGSSSQPGGERSFVADRGAADLLAAGRPPGRLVRTARMRSTCRPTRCSASRSGRPAGGRSSSRATRARAISVDLASIGPLLAGGRRAARGTDRGGRAGPAVRDGGRGRGARRRTRRRWVARHRRDRRRQAGSEGRHGPRPGRRRTDPPRGRHGARRRGRHDRRRATRSMPGSSSAGSRRGAPGDRCRRRSSARRWPVIGRPRASCRRRGPSCRCSDDHRPTRHQPRGLGRARRGPSGRRPRIDADQPRASVPREPGRRPGIGGRRARDRRHPGDRRDPRRAGARRVGRRGHRGARDRSARVRPQGRPAEPGSGHRRWRVGGDDRLGDDDRRPCRGDPGVCDRRDRRRPSRRARRAATGRRRRSRARRGTWPRHPPSTSRPTSRSSDGPRWPSCARGRRRSSTCRRRSSTSRRAASRSSPSGNPTCPASSPARPAYRRPSRVADIAAAATVVATHLELGLGGAILVCVPVPEADALPRDLARQAVEAAIADAASAGIGGPALTPWLLARIAVLTDGRVGACQHGAHPQRRPGRGRAGGAAGRRLTAGRCPRRARHLAARSGARYTRGRPGRGPLTRGGTDHDADL